MRRSDDTVCPSSDALRLAMPRTPPAVYKSVALPFVVVEEGLANVPSVAENVIGVPFGIVPPEDVSALAELNVTSAVMVEDSPGSIKVRVVRDVNTRNGLAATVPATPLGVPAQPAPPAPGPKLHPHQLFVAVMVA
jgi:hypothetical protein